MVKQSEKSAAELEIESFLRTYDTNYTITFKDYNKLAEILSKCLQRTQEIRSSRDKWRHNSERDTANLQQAHHTIGKLTKEIKRLKSLLEDKQ